jgi:UDP-N-acetylmuramoylalanine--D-glutamate ligase
MVAIEAFPQPKVLILGGSGKGSDFRGLGRTISRAGDAGNIRAIVGIGAEWPRIKAAIHNKNITIIEGCKTMKEVVRAANRIARRGDAALLSPACASFGMFANYTERGDQFRRAVKALK